MEKLKLLQDLAKQNKQKEFGELYKELTEEEIKEIEEKLGVYKNVNDHNYSGFNLVFLSMAKDPGTFGTFTQWRNNGRQVKKGAKGVGLLAPIFKEGTENKSEIAFFKTIYVFHINDTDLVDNKKDKGDE